MERVGGETVDTEAVINQQYGDVIASDFAVESTGGDPYADPPATQQAADVDIGVWIGNKMIARQMRDNKLAEVDANFDVPGMNGYRDNIINRYKLHNDGLTSEDPVVRAWQSRPIEVEPNEHAEWSGMLAQWHQARIDGITHKKSWRNRSRASSLQRIS